MPPGFDQPTSSSASRSSGTSFRDQTQRTRQGRNDAPTQPGSVSARRKSLNQPSLTLPQQPTDSQSVSPGRKSPAYLEGKNPYGQILDDVNHPYRRPKPTGGAPAQVGATLEGRPRTSGSFQFKTRPEPEREVIAPDSSPPPLSPRTSANPGSVRAAKDFFESKALPNRSDPPLPPPAATTATGRNANSRVTDRYLFIATRRRSKDGTTRAPRLASPNSRIAVRNESDIEPPMRHSPPIVSGQLDPSWRTDPVARHKSNSMARVKAPQGAPGHDSSKLDEVPNSTLTALEHAGTADDYHIYDETVRRCPIRSLSAAESEQVAAEGTSKSYGQSWRPQIGRTVRRSVEDGYQPVAKRSHERKSHGAPLIDERAHAWRRISSRSCITSETDVGHSPSDDNSDDNQIGPDNVFKRVAEYTPNSFSHDGSGSTPSLSYRSTSIAPVPSVPVRTRSGEPYVAVPDHVDWRGAYGRRQTKDFGYPGARIKPRSADRTYIPLDDPGNWTKRACGHFSYMGSTESREDAPTKLCQQCRFKTRPLEPLPARQQRTRPRAAMDFSLSTSCSPKKVDHTCDRMSRRRERHSKSSPPEKCGYPLVEDLEYLIDSILEEHTTMLQGVIDNITHAQPNLARIRSMSEDLAQRCQVRDIYTRKCHKAYQHSDMHQTGCQSCQPDCQLGRKSVQQVCK